METDDNSDVNFVSLLQANIQAISNIISISQPNLPKRKIGRPTNNSLESC